MGSKATKSPSQGTTRRGGGDRLSVQDQMRIATPPVFPMEQLQQYAANRFPVNNPPSTSQPLDVTLKVRPPQNVGGFNMPNPNRRNEPMGPGQSMAMAGNTGLATASENQANAILKGLQNLGRDASFQSIGQNIGETGSKYRRPADVEGYASKMDTINKAFDAGAKTFTGPDGIDRINLSGTGLKDDQGRTILSMMNPELTATAPTLSQLGGDISRGVTGFNSLQYTDPSINRPEMVRTQGLADVLAKAAIPGSAAFNILKDLVGKGKNLFFPQDEDDNTISLSDVRPAMTSNEAYFIPPKFNEQDLTTLPVDEQSTTPVTQSGNMTSEDFQDMYPYLFNEEDDLSASDMENITDYLSRRGVLPFAYGGTVAPKSGPMSEGIGTLYNTR
jgi:hypothetical protein|tara:strand:- start:1261 stop:2427 length:1167 start_codon:yes stop_codon:yes gene_type:complete